MHCFDNRSYQQMQRLQDMSIKDMNCIVRTTFSKKALEEWKC